MGLFDRFKKQDCEICGKEVGMFGYKKLEDGEICKDCVKLLSPWFDDRRHSTVAQIKEQLAYREANRKNLDSFRPAVSFGENYTLRAELVNGVPTRFVVERTDSYMSENADLIGFNQVTAFDVDVQTHERELKRKNANGEMVSYVPARYEYSFDFYAKINVNCTYFNEIRFRLNRNTVNLETTVGGMRSGMGLGQSLGLLGRNMGGFDPMLYPEYRQYSAMIEELKQLFRSGMQGMPMNAGFGQAAPGYGAPMGNAYGQQPAGYSQQPVGYGQQPTGADPLLKMIEQIKSAPDLGTVFSLQSEIAHQATSLPEFEWSRIKALTEAAVEAAKQRIIAQETGSAPVQEAPKPKFCPNCGAPSDGGKFCQSCGSMMA